MTEAQKKMKKYTSAVERRLNLPRDVKSRVMNDFISAIQSRRDEGMSDEEIFEELGSPIQAAATLNEQMKDFTYQKSPWRWLCLALSGLFFIRLFPLMHIGMVISLPVEQSSVGIIGGADGPTAIFVTQAPSNFILNLLATLVLLGISIAGFCILSRLKRK